MMTYWKIIYLDGKKKRELTMLAESAGQAVYFAQLAFRIQNVEEVLKMD